MRNDEDGGINDAETMGTGKRGGKIGSDRRGDETQAKTNTHERVARKSQDQVN